MQAYPKTGESYETEAKFKISLPQIGTYNISFFTIMSCDAISECEAPGDYVRVVMQVERAPPLSSDMRVVEDVLLGEVRYDSNNKDKWVMTSQIYTFKDDDSSSIDVV